MLLVRSIHIPRGGGLSGGILTFLALGLDAGGDDEPEPPDGEDHLVPPVHELVLHLDGPLPALLPPVPAPNESHRYLP